MTVLVSTEPRRVVGVLIGGSLVAVALWLVHLNAAGLLGIASTVLALVVGGLTVAFGASVVVEGRIDRQSRQRLIASLRCERMVSGANRHRCELCRRPLVMVGDVHLCATCDQPPSL